MYLSIPRVRHARSFAAAAIVATLAGCAAQHRADAPSSDGPEIISAAVFAPQEGGTLSTFTVQFRLDDNGSPATGPHDFVIELRETNDNLLYTTTTHTGVQPQEGGLYTLLVELPADPLDLQFNSGPEEIRVYVDGAADPIVLPIHPAPRAHLAAEAVFANSSNIATFAQSTNQAVSAAYAVEAGTADSANTADSADFAFFAVEADSANTIAEVITTHITANGMATFGPDWEDFGGAFGPPEITAIGNRYELSGMIRNRGVAGFNTTIFELDPSLRPANRQICMALGFDGNYQTYRVDIIPGTGPNDPAIIQLSSWSSGDPEPVWISLNGVKWVERSSR